MYYIKLKFAQQVEINSNFDQTKHLKIHYKQDKGEDMEVIFADR